MVRRVGGRRAPAKTRIAPRQWAMYRYRSTGDDRAERRCSRHVTPPCDNGMRGIMRGGAAPARRRGALRIFVASVWNGLASGLCAMRRGIARLMLGVPSGGSPTASRMARCSTSSRLATRLPGPAAVVTPCARRAQAPLSSAGRLFALPHLHRREHLLLRRAHAGLDEVSRGEQADLPAAWMRPEIAPDVAVAPPHPRPDAEEFGEALRRPVTWKSLKPLHRARSRTFACGT